MVASARVNMAAGGCTCIGGSFWEFGEPDWERSRYLMLWGVAEDHDSNPIKMGTMKKHGAKIVCVNPIRSGLTAPSPTKVDRHTTWHRRAIPAFALIHELLRTDRIDLDYLVRILQCALAGDRRSVPPITGCLHAMPTANPLSFDGERTAACWQTPPASNLWSLAVTLPDGRKSRAGVPAHR